MASVAEPEAVDLASVLFVLDEQPVTTRTAAAAVAVSATVRDLRMGEINPLRKCWPNEGS